jgi:hypothetical protein
MLLLRLMEKRNWLISLSLKRYYSERMSSDIFWSEPRLSQTNVEQFRHAGNTPFGYSALGKEL